MGNNLLLVMLVQYQPAPPTLGTPAAALVGFSTVSTGIVPSPAGYAMVDWVRAKMGYPCHKLAFYDLERVAILV